MASDVGWSSVAAICCRGAAGLKQVETTAVGRGAKPVSGHGIKTDVADVVAHQRAVLCSTKGCRSCGGTAARDLDLDRRPKRPWWLKIAACR